MTRIRAAKATFSTDDYLDEKPHVQSLLREARDSVGHALCLCTTPARQLVLREVRGILYLTVWPGDGGWHHPSCFFHRADPLSSAHEVEPHDRNRKHTPIATIDKNGWWVVDIDLPRHQTPHVPRPLQPGPGTTKQTVGAEVQTQSGMGRHKSTSLMAFFQWWWDSTSLGIWCPERPARWAGVKHKLTNAISSHLMRGMALENLIYVPPPYTREQRPDLEKRWSRFLGDIRRAGPAGLGFVAAEIKRISRSEFGYKLELKHLLQPVFVSETVHAKTAKNHLLHLTIASAVDRPEKSRVMAMVAIEETSMGNIRAIDMALLLTSSEYVPCKNLAEIRLANHLTKSGRSFTKGQGGTAADFVLNDTLPPTAMVITTTCSTEQQRRAERVLSDMQQANRAVWRWTPATGESIPELPRKHIRTTGQ